MRRLIVIVPLALAAAFAAGCASTEAGWTYAPPTEAPVTEPPASADASAAPSADAGGQPSEAPSENAVSLTAQNISWQQTALSAPAGTPFTVRLNNMDTGVPHDIAIKDASGNELFKGDVVTGPAEMDYQVPALDAGTYQLVCTIHPNMVATLTVGG